MGFRRWFGDLRPGEQVLFGAIAAAVIGAVITGMFTLEATGSAGAPGEDSSGHPSYHPPSVPTRPGTDLPTPDNTASTFPTSTPSPSLASAGPVDLTSLRPSSSDMEYDIAASRMGGVSYPLALKFDATSSNESTVEYAFSNQYSTMKGWFGLDDDSPNSHAVAHVRLTDERDRLLAK